LFNAIVCRENRTMTMLNNKILVIEDDTDAVFLLKESLSKFRESAFTVTAFNTYSETLDLNLKEYDLIISDLELPDIKSVDLIRNIRMRAEFVPLLIVTSHSHSSLIIEVMKLGVKDFLVKEETIYEILPHRVKMCIEDSRMQRVLANRLRERENAMIRMDTLRKTLATISHFINNSTTAISGYAQLCRIDPEQKERYDSLVDLAISESKKISIVLEEFDTAVRENRELPTTDYADLQNAMYDLSKSIEKRMNSSIS